MPVPRITIVTSSFNQAAFIGRTIESVMAQDYPNLEHIVVDGMSSDDTATVLARYPHLTVIREPDKGQADAINKGFRAATGEVFGFLNSDDTFEPGALHAVAAAIDPGRGRHIVMGRCRFIDEEDRFLGVEHPMAFESHRRVLEIWKGHCLPQPSTFWTRDVWQTAGPLSVNEQMMLDYDLFCRFSRRYVFHPIDRILANYRLHLQSKTSSMTDAQRLDQAVVVSRRYWGAPWGVQYWRIRASYAAYRFNRRVRAAQLMRTGRDQWRDGKRVSAAGRLVAGVVLAPDVALDVGVIPALRPAVGRVKTSVRRRRHEPLPQTRAWFGQTTLHADGWAGPSLVLPVSIQPGDTKCTLTAATMLDRLPKGMSIEAIVSGKSLGVRDVQADQFTVSWPLALPPGEHEVTLRASAYIVPDEVFGNQDYRPLSFRLPKLDASASS